MPDQIPDYERETPMPIRSTPIHLALLTSLALGVGCQTTTPAANQNNTAQEPSSDFAPETTAFLWVKGIGCPLCVPNIEDPLTALPGVDRVHVDLSTGKVDVALNPAHPATQQALIDAIDDSGFTLDRIEMPEQ